MPEEHAQGLVEYALILILAAIIVIGALAVVGSSIEAAYCEIVGLFPGSENPCGLDVVVITWADYVDGMLHIDATSDGGYNSDVTLTVSSGGVMVKKADHYHAHYALEVPAVVVVTSSAGGSASVTVGS
jgi:Flp pilus assembly pilin Flp